MKPTVIPTGNNTNSQGINNNNMNLPTGNVLQDSNNNPTTGRNFQSHNAGRQFPNYQQGFGFDADADDVFSDSGIRSRLPGRMRDPFTSFGTRKSCGNENFSDPYIHYFEDETDDFFPGFGQIGSGGRNRANLSNVGDDRFFSNFPDEFRQYIPEGFGFARRSNINQPAQQPYYQQAPQPQYYQQPMYQQTGQYDNVPYYEQQPIPQSPKPQLCDAAIQTEDFAAESQDTFPMSTGSKLQQHGLRNTVDMGQKSIQEEENRSPRSHSAPPINKDGVLGNKPQQHLEEPVYVSKATLNASATKKLPTAVISQGSNNSPSPPNPPQRHSSIPQTQVNSGESYIRTVPIFVEGRQSPVINSHKEIPNQNQHTQQQSSRPTINTAKANQPDFNQTFVPPQTPHTTDCINKITDIQRDVLNLMTQVENFKGRKNDKEYMYLDEMLTRNLLKLDTIDTNGKESIRLARKEAIKCIQASINVLEAKSGENAKAALINNYTDTDEYSNKQHNIFNEIPNILNEQLVIPLPPPPEYNNEQKLHDASPNILNENTIIILPAPQQINTGEIVENLKEPVTIKIKTKEQSPEAITAGKLDENNAVETKFQAENNVKELSPSKEGAKTKIIKKIKKITKKEKSPSPSEIDQKKNE